MTKRHISPLRNKSDPKETLDSLNWKKSIRLTLHYKLHICSDSCNSWDRTHDIGVACAMLKPLSYRTPKQKSVKVNILLLWILAYNIFRDFLRSIPIGCWAAPHLSLPAVKEMLARGWSFPLSQHLRLCEIQKTRKTRFVGQRWITARCYLLLPLAISKARLKIITTITATKCSVPNDVFAKPKFNLTQHAADNK